MNRVRAHVRRADVVRLAVEEVLLATFGDSDLSKFWWDHTFTDETEADAKHEKYTAERRLARSRREN